MYLQVNSTQYSLQLSVSDLHALQSNTKQPQVWGLDLCLAVLQCVYLLQTHIHLGMGKSATCADRMVQTYT